MAGGGGQVASSRELTPKHKFSALGWHCQVRGDPHLSPMPSVTGRRDGPEVIRAGQLALPRGSHPLQHSGKQALYLTGQHNRAVPGSGDWSLPWGCECGRVGPASCFLSCLGEEDGQIPSSPPSFLTIYGRQEIWPWWSWECDNWPCPSPGEALGWVDPIRKPPGQQGRTGPGTGGCWWDWPQGHKKQKSWRADQLRCHSGPDPGLWISSVMNCWSVWRGQSYRS